MYSKYENKIYINDNFVIISDFCAQMNEKEQKWISHISHMLLKFHVIMKKGEMTVEINQDNNTKQ